MVVANLFGVVYPNIINVGLMAIPCRFTNLNYPSNLIKAPINLLAVHTALNKVI